jgi:hypothetical protein
MDDRFAKRRQASRILKASVGVAVGVMLIYMGLYWWEPLAQPWNDWAIYLLILAAALLAAVIGTAVWRQFPAGDPPRRVWGFFALGLWAFTLGELVWLAMRPFYEEFPDVSAFDVCWVAAYAFFILSLYFQHRLIYSAGERGAWRWLAVIWVLLIGVTLVLTLAAYRAGWAQDWTPLGAFLAILYPVGDAVIVLASLNLSRLFGRGLWGRAWWGLLAFAISDGITSWYYLGGSALLTEQSDALLSLFTDTLYFGAYVLLAFAGLSQYLLLRHGPPVRFEDF